MKLKEYEEKRDFFSTPEPKAVASKTKGAPSFVVQKHAATSLHYDFRLEIGKVLKSWAIPKGPSMDPSVKRLAIMVEDHPLDYLSFEGIIPPGNYGAGKVEIWDKGNFIPASGNIRDLESGLGAGHLSIIINGDKLKGEFALVKIKTRDNKNNWLLVKADDEYARKN